MNKKLYLILLFSIFSFIKVYSQSINIDARSIGMIVINDKIKGSAFIAHKPNLVITCAHVILPYLNSEIYYHEVKSDKKHILEVIGFNADKDIALLKANSEILPSPLKFAKNFDLSLGQHLFYLGYDSGMLDKKPASYKANNAVISTIGTTKIGDSFADFIEFKGVGIPGYSGGVVINDDNLVVAIITQGWLQKDLKKGNTVLINRAFSITPILEIMGWK